MRALLALGLGVIAASGCGQGAKGGCPQLDSCGGSVVGTWARISDACQFQPFRPAQAVDTTDFIQNPPIPAMIAPPQPNPVVAQQTTSGDWCSSLLYNPDDSVSNAVLWHDGPLLDKASITFGSDNTYVTTLTFSTTTLPPERNTTHFARRCLLAGGAPPTSCADGSAVMGSTCASGATPLGPTCAKLAAALTTFYKPVTSPQPNFTNIMCADTTDGGCDCTYVYNVIVSDQGMYKADSGTGLLLQDSSNGAFQYNGAPVNSQSPATTIQSTFCAQGGTLELSGMRGGSLFGVQGLRTMVLAPP